MQKHLFALSLGASLAVGCGGSSENPQDTQFATGNATEDGTLGSDDFETGSADGMGDGDGDGPGDGDGDGDPGDGDGDGDPGDGDGDGDGDGEPGDGDGEACASVSENANFVEVPADIIFIVDNSGSMDAEAGFVQAEMNGFSAQISNSGIDHHVVLLSSYPGDGNGICIDPPLGGGGCNNDDNNLPVYRHVDERIGSSNALSKLIQFHNEWAPSIRPDSVKHIVVVSDDESNISANSFNNQFLALDPSYDPYIFHAIVCPYDCPESADVGDRYMDLVDSTGGVLGDLCLQDFQTVFDELADAVIQGVPVSCQFDIPEPPMGMNLDPNLVNVELDDGNNNTQEIPRVTDLADCMNYPDGWYYDDPVNPMQIFLCPQTCETAQSYPMGSVNVLFGCETIVPQ